MSDSLLLQEDFGSVRMLTLNRPKALNALNQSLLSLIDEQVQSIAESDEIRAVVLTGAGEKAFAAGADITELQSLSPLQAQEVGRYGSRVMERIRQMDTPVIAAVNGFALGGGLELALACDFIYASESASFGLVEANLGLIPGYRGVSRLARRIGEANAREALFCARRYRSDEALRLGLVNRVFPDGELIVETLKVAQTIAEKSPTAIGLLRSLFESTRSADAAACEILEQQAFGLAFASADAKEGIEAFLEKRKPNFGP